MNVSPWSRGCDRGDIRGRRGSDVVSDDRRCQKRAVPVDGGLGSMIITRRSLPRPAFLLGLGAPLALLLLDGMVPVKKLLAKGVSLDARTAKRASGSSAGAAPRDPG